MSLRSIIWAFDQEVFPSSRKFVLVALANFAGDTGKSYPGVETLEKITGLKHEAIRNALADLVSHGIVQDTGERSGSTSQIKVYQLPVAACEAKDSIKPILKDSAKTRQRLGKDSVLSCDLYTRNLEHGTRTPIPVNIGGRKGKCSLDELSEYLAGPHGGGYSKDSGCAQDVFDKFEASGWTWGNRDHVPDWKAASRIMARQWRSSQNEPSRHSHSKPRSQFDLQSQIDTIKEHIGTIQANGRLEEDGVITDKLTPEAQSKIKAARLKIDELMKEKRGLP